MFLQKIFNIPYCHKKTSHCSVTLKIFIHGVMDAYTAYTSLFHDLWMNEMVKWETEPFIKPSNY